MKRPPLPPVPSGRRARWLLRGALALALLAVAWTLAVGVWLPRFLQPRIEAEAGALLGAPLTLERIDIAPWTLDVRAFELRLGPPGAPWLHIAEVHGDVSIESLWQRAPVLRRFTLRRPRVELERYADGRYNVSPMLEALARRPAAPTTSEPARFAVHNIRLEDGSIHLVDHRGGGEHRVGRLQVGVPFVSNLPSQLAVDVEPSLSADVDGSRLQLQGRTQPFTDGRRSAIDVQWEQIDVAQALAAVAPLVAGGLPLEVQEGRLDVALQVAFERQGAGVAPSLQIGGRAALSGVRARAPAHGVQMAFERLAVDGLALRPFERRVSAERVALQAPALELDLPRLRAAPTAAVEPVPKGSRPASAGAASSAGSASSASAPGAPGGTRAADDGWQWHVAALAVEAGSVRLREPAWSADQVLAPVQLTARGLDSRDARPAPFTLAVADARGARVALDGTLTPAASQASVRVDVTDLQPAPWLAPWQALLPVQLQDARVALQGRAEVDQAGWSVRDGALQVTGLQVAPPAAPASGPARSAGTSTDDRLRVARVAASGVELAARAGRPLDVALAAVQVDGLDLKASRRADGSFAWATDPVPATRAAAPPGPRALPAGARAAVPAPAATRAAAAPTPGARPGRAVRASASRAPAAEPAVAWRVGELRCSGCAIALVDRGTRPAGTLAFTRAELRVARLGSDFAQPVELELATQVGRAGRAKVRGQVRPQPLALRARVDLAGVDLGLLQPYLDPYVNLTLVSAKASAAGELRMDGSARDAVASARWQGRLALGDVRTLDRVNDAEFVRFKALTLDGADIAWRPGGYEADLGTVSLDDFYGRVIIDPDGRINLRDIVRREDEARRSLTTPGGAAPAPGTAASAPTATGDASASPAAASPAANATATAPATAPAAASSPASAATPLRWRAIRVSRGEVDFTDNFIRPNYSARLTGIAGEVSALAWDDPKPAEVRLAGAVDRSAPLQVSGTLHPLGARLHTDLQAEARGIDMTRLSAYAARWAGYGIEKGTLTAKVRYRVDNGRLQADHSLYLDQLTFGEKVDSPDALKVPVLLAVSLLKDRRGVIDVNLPVSGSLDDPQFSLGGIIVRVLVNLVVKAVTAPFALLGQAFGGGQQELSYVEFEPASAAIAPPVASALETLAKALAERPALKLEITGRADPALDAPALRRAHVERLLRLAKARATGQPVDDVRVEPAERGEWLAAAYRAADLKGKPRNVVGLAKSIPPADMEALLLDSAAVGPQELKTLADARADGVKAWLSGKVPSERLLLTASRADATGIDDKGRTTRVGFTLK